MRMLHCHVRDGGSPANHVHRRVADLGEASRRIGGDNSR